MRDGHLCYYNDSMNKDDLDIYSIPQLVDLLIQTTKELLDLMNNKSKDSRLIFEKRKQVQIIQEIINERKTPAKKL
jgi:hypothetical protein